VSEDEFRSRLRAFLLAVESEGHDVAGVWHLVDTDPVVPNFRVEIEPLGDASGYDDKDGSFAVELQDLLLREYAEGTRVVGTREVVTRPSDGHGWRVTITRDAADAPDTDAPWNGADE
jgi:hypothetical protein